MKAEITMNKEVKESLEDLIKKQFAKNMFLMVRAIPNMILKLNDISELIMELSRGIDKACCKVPSEMMAQVLDDAYFLNCIMSNSETIRNIDNILTFVEFPPKPLYSGEE